MSNISAGRYHLGGCRYGSGTFYHRRMPKGKTSDLRCGPHPGTSQRRALEHSGSWRAQLRPHAADVDAISWRNPNSPLLSNGVAFFTLSDV